jgi:hypothetical protein
MSHNRRFLRDLWDLPLPTDERKALWCMPFGMKNTHITEWPIETETESEDDANRRALVRFFQHSEGDPRDIIKKLRPVLETHMQRSAPQLLKGVTGLGSMLGVVRDANAPAVLLAVYDEIDDVNTYTRPYMHGDGRNQAGEPPSREELHGMVGKVLEIAGHC